MFPLLLLACSTSGHIQLGGDDTDRDTAIPTDDSADELPSESSLTLGEPVMTPEGGAFVGEATVTLDVDGGDGDLEFCRADPGDTDCTFQAYTGPITLGASTILHARVNLEGQLSRTIGHSFVEVDDTVGAFSSTVPVLIFWTTGSAPDSTDDVSIGLTVVEPAEGGEVTVLDTPIDSGRGRIHVHGSSSSGFEKKAYDLELRRPDNDDDRKASLGGMPKNGDWVLYAPYYFDEALVRNPLAYALSNTVGRYAPHTQFAEVFLAQRHRAVTSADYLGVYVITEEVEIDADRVAITPMLPEDVAEPEVTGGYLFKIDRTGTGESGFYAGSGGGVWQFQQSFVNVQPSESELVRPQSSYLTATLDSIGDALVRPDLTDPRTGLRYDELLDVDSFIDHHILNVYLKNPDSFRLSGYMFKDREGLVQAGPLWDFDRAAASADSRAWLPTWWDDQNETTDCTDVWEFGWYPGLFDDPVFADRYWARMEELLRGDLSNDAVDAQIDALVTPLDAPAARNSTRWGSSDYRARVAELKAWLHTRNAWMLQCIDTYPDPRDCPG